MFKTCEHAWNTLPIMKPLVLIIEDEPDIAATLGKYLERAGMRVNLALDGQRGLEAFASEKPDLVILDMLLPGVPGAEVLRRIRGSSQVPIIALTALAAQQDRLNGFELGADDYVTKPFYPLELVSRVQAVLRRSGVQTVLRGREGLSVSLEHHRATLRDAVLELRPTEFSLLSAFLRAPGRVFTRAELLEAIGDDARDTLERTMDVHIRNLRQKLGEHHGIETVFGVGYRYAID
jgi:two-component system, OmpR family, response regulator AdeR